MQKANQARMLQILVILNLALLAFLLIFGLAFETKGLGGGSGADISPTAIIRALHTAGGSSFIHIIAGLFVGLFSLVNMILALRSGMRLARIFGTLAFLSILSAGTLGLFFIISGFQAQTLVYGLVPLFILAVVSFLVEFFSLRAVPRPQTN